MWLIFRFSLFVIVDSAALPHESTLTLTSRCRSCCEIGAAPTLTSRLIKGFINEAFVDLQSIKDSRGGGSDSDWPTDGWRLLQSYHSVTKTRRLNGWLPSAAMWWCVVGAPVLVGLRWSELWESWRYVEESGSSWKPPARRSERDHHPAGLRSAALSNHPPGNKAASGSKRLPLNDSRQIWIRHPWAPLWCSLCRLCHAAPPQHRYPSLRRCLRMHPPTSGTYRQVETIINAQKEFFFVV